MDKLTDAELNKLTDEELVDAYFKGWNSCPTYFNDQELYGLRAVQEAVAAKNMLTFPETTK